MGITTIQKMINDNLIINEIDYGFGNSRSESDKIYRLEEGYGKIEINCNEAKNTSKDKKMWKVYTIYRVNTN